MASWQPQEAGLLELIGLFRESQSMEQEVQMRIADVSDTPFPLKRG
jgi:hypothetical protein